MPNMRLKKNPMPAQEPEVRSHNFDEVALGYTAEQAVEEAQRCLNCNNKPCVSGCPVQYRHSRLSSHKVAEGDFEGAYQIISRSTRAARRLRPCLPPGKPVREAAASAASRASRWASAGWSASWPTGIGAQRTAAPERARAQRPQGGGDRLRPLPA